MAVVSSFFEDFLKKNISNTKLHSNKAINTIATSLDGIGDSFYNIWGKGQKDGETIWGAIKRAHTVDNLGEKIDAKKIAGSVVGVGTGARIVSGGGLYRDQNGNPDIIGIPFI